MEGYADSAQVGKIPVSAQVTSRFGTAEANLVHISLEFPWNSLKHVWSGDNLYTTIGVLGRVYNKNGSLLARFSDAPCLFGSSKPWNYCDSCTRDRAFLEYYGIPGGYEAQIDLPPGDYELRAVVTDGVKFGRAEVPLKVDSYDLSNLEISGMVLCKRFHDVLSGPTLYARLVSKGVEFAPTADTVFQKNDRLISYFEINEPAPRGTGAAKVQFQMRITDAKSGELKMDTGLRPTESWVRSGNPVIAIAQEVVIDKLPAGTYRLEVQASDSAGNHTAWRATTFTVA
jgi:hypothetical protein